MALISDGKQKYRTNQCAMLALGQKVHYGCKAGVF